MRLLVIGYSLPTRSSVDRHNNTTEEEETVRSIPSKPSRVPNTVRVQRQREAVVSLITTFSYLESQTGPALAS